MNNFKRNYEKILVILQKIESKKNFLNQIRLPRLSDIELIAVDLTAEYMSIDSEHHLFRMLSKSITRKIERSVYNRRRRKLFFHRELIRRKIVESLVMGESYYIVDSMPLEICRLSRSSRKGICHEYRESSPSRGYCASQKFHYYGYKLHALCSIEGVFTHFDLAPANIHDIHYLKDIPETYSHSIILADKGYLSQSLQLELFESNNIRLEVAQRKNQKNYQKQEGIIKKSRKRIETLFAGLCDQFMIRRNYAKTFEGFKNRILSKIMAMTLIQFNNKLNNNNINHIKTSVL